MLILLSPSKTLDASSPCDFKDHSLPLLVRQSEKIVRVLKKKKPSEVASLMGISLNLAQVNAARYAAWQLPFTTDNARQAIFLFKGDVYTGFSVEEFEAGDLVYAQSHLRILSGLYGILRPLDLIQPYRLEMGTSIEIGGSPDLYRFWHKHINGSLKETLAAQGDDILINLASLEYSRAVDFKKLRAKVITPVFKERKGDTFQMVSFFAKRARGMMAAYILKGRLTEPEAILHFSEDGYAYNDRLSKPEQPVFTRE